MMCVAAFVAAASVEDERLGEARLSNSSSASNSLQHQRSLKLGKCPPNHSDVLYDVLSARRHLSLDMERGSQRLCARKSILPMIFLFNFVRPLWSQRFASSWVEKLAHHLHISCSRRKAANSRNEFEFT